MHTIGVPGGYSNSLGAQQLEPELAADRVRGRVVDRRERVDEAMLAVLPGHGDRLRGGGSRDAPTLERRDDRPPGLVDPPAVPLPLPVADEADRLAGLDHDGLEYPAGVGADLLVAALALDDFLRRLGPAEVLHHLRIANELEQQVEIPGGPGLDPYRCR